MSCFNHALEIALDLGDWTSLLGQLGNLGLSAAAQGRTDIADRLLERAVQLARTLTAPYLLCEFLYWLAKLRADRPGGYAEQLNAEALEIADRIDHRHHRLHCRLLAIRLAAGDTTADQLHALLPHWPEPAEQAAIHTHLWRHAHETPSRHRAIALILDLYQHAPSEELREQLTTLTDTPPPACPALPDLAPEITHTTVNLEAILHRVTLDTGN